MDVFDPETQRCTHLCLNEWYNLREDFGACPRSEAGTEGGQDSKVSVLLVLFFFFQVYLFIMFLRESRQKRDRERGRERIPSRLCAVRAEPNTGLDLMNHEIMT